MGYLSGSGMNVNIFLQFFSCRSSVRVLGKPPFDPVRASRLSLFPSNLQGGIVLAVPVDLVAHHASAEPASVLVFVSIGQDEKQGLYHRHCPFARGAVKLGGLEFIKA